MSLREDAIAVWKAGVTAVDSARLVENSISCDANHLTICDEQFSIAELHRIEVVGAGKAGVGMARGLIQALRKLPCDIPLSGWINVPDDCVETIPGIHLHPARPAGINEPTSAGVEGTLRIIERLAGLREADLCIVLISGGGSALLPAPVPEISLDDKLTVTRLLASSGAPINELNVVRSQLSLVKGGGLLQHAKAGRIIALIISDVIGDPLDIIASGPTTPSASVPHDAFAILQKYDPLRNAVPSAVIEFLKNAGRKVTKPPCRARNFIIGSSDVALSAAAAEAQKRGYRVMNLGSENAGDAVHHGQTLFSRLMELRESVTAPDGPSWCVLAGGETTVQLATTDQPRLGGRNQEVVLGAVWANQNPHAWNGIALLSGGTDGEDGPTDAAGAIADQSLISRMVSCGLDPARYLKINNSYPFFRKLDGLLMTGPTHTNVMDLAVGIVGR